MEQFFQVGVITSTHGIRGEVKVFPTTSDPQRFRKLKEVILASEKEQVSLEIQSVRFSKQFVIVRFRGIDDINEVEKYKGRQLLVARKDAAKLEKDEYYIADLLGIPPYEAFRRFIMSKTYANFRKPGSALSMCGDPAIVEEFLSENK